MRDTDAVGTTKRMVCFANSRKLNGRCVAGVELADGSPVGWIRPVSDREHQEVSKYERQYEDGSDPRVLDIIDVPLVKWQPGTYQKENWLLNPDVYWAKAGTMEWADLEELAQPSGDLWVNGLRTYHGLNDEVAEEDADRLDSSLTPTLNTLWVDKSLRAHGLLQAFSRTNRILNSVKTFGNIVSFRNLEEETNDAIALFGNKDAQGVVLLKPFGEYYDEYAEKVKELLAEFPLGQQIVGEAAQTAFIALFGAILRLRNILQSFDEFVGNEVLSARSMQDYQSVYLNLYAELRGQHDADKESILDDIVFEIELIKQVEINVDYILLLVEQYREAKGDGSDKEIRAAIERAVDSSPSLRNKKDLIEAFVDSLSITSNVDSEWQAFVEARRAEELEQIITDEGLNREQTLKYIENAFRDGAIQPTGIAITRILPPVSKFAIGGGHSAKKQSVLDKLGKFFDRFFGLS